MQTAGTDPRADKDVEETKAEEDNTCGPGDDATNDEEKQVDHREQTALGSANTVSAVGEKNGIRLLDVGSKSVLGCLYLHANEDRYVVESNERFHLFAVIDGHAGSKTADFLVGELFKTSLDELDSRFCALIAPKRNESGACLLAILLYVDPSTNIPQKIVLNVGDCRAIVREAPDKRVEQAPTSSDAKTVALSEDHCVHNAKEKALALRRGAAIWDGRIAGILQPFRAFGNIHLKGPDRKNWVIATPEIHQSELLIGRSIFVIATDGVWGTMNNERAMKIAVEELGANGSAQSSANAIADAASRQTNDDVTVIVVSV
ncbi:uncharacterized protein PITG_02656 [Phytophthora infestans T30-4]|uniref:PPM-type phosphatase domain-containing protein n=1 Tax=Phytophthora infestans (strain T30-4) TaxID=403677 RepID=D0MWW4_PHYIT|nr:uncharacterized protein PITG_02656 [Phytophthora infestans T30-4]EEY64127.1 conserved hypothetical protein [Phytophthora infestans T30-4]|eukprot:XP_002907563.1 conserved hypothetical protein [Phytophthora infestans T30-4]